MTINLVEGWLTLDIIYTDGTEHWIFHKVKPDNSFSEYWDGYKKEFVSPGVTKRIMYVEVQE